jgi:hypothetical protein
MEPSITFAAASLKPSTTIHTIAWLALAHSNAEADVGKLKDTL